MGTEVSHQKVKQLEERSENTGWETFTGVVESADLEIGLEDRKQYHIVMKPEDLEVSGPTKCMHEWIGLSEKATEEKVPQGSVLDRYLTQIEMLVDGASKAKTVGAALKMMVGKKFKFKKIKLGRDFDGHKAKEYIVPVALVQ